MRWNANTNLHGVQFDWEDEPTARPVRLSGGLPREGQPVRIGMGGAEVECVIVRFAAGVLHVRLAKPQMEKVIAPTPARRKKVAG